MWRRIARAGVGGAVLLALLAAGPAMAIDWRTLANERVIPASPRHYIAAPPGSEFYPQYPMRPPTMGTPAYQWGYFGARSSPVTVRHQGYCGDVRAICFPGR